jgi:hypothetical protein
LSGGFICEKCRHEWRDSLPGLTNLDIARILLALSNRKPPQWIAKNIGCTVGQVREISRYSSAERAVYRRSKQFPHGKSAA